MADGKCPKCGGRMFPTDTVCISCGQALTPRRRPDHTAEPGVAVAAQGDGTPEGDREVLKGCQTAGLIGCAIVLPVLGLAWALYYRVSDDPKRKRLGTIGAATAVAAMVLGVYIIGAVISEGVVALESSGTASAHDRNLSSGGSAQADSPLTERDLTSGLTAAVKSDPFFGQCGRYSVRSITPSSGQYDYIGTVAHHNAFSASVRGHVRGGRRHDWQFLNTASY